MNWFKSMLKILGPRLLSVLAAVVVAKAAEKGITLDPIETSAVMLGTYATIHRTVSSKFNPGDAAKGRLVVAEQDAIETGSVVQPERE